MSINGTEGEIMRELLYMTAVNPPEQVLHHAILYRDSISTIDIRDSDALILEGTRIAEDAGLLKVVAAPDVLENESIYHITRDLWDNSVEKMMDALGNMIADPIPGKEGAVRSVLGEPLTLSESHRLLDLLIPVLLGDGRHHQDRVDHVNDLQDAVVRVVLRTCVALSLERQSRENSSVPVVVLCHEDAFSKALRGFVDAVHESHLYSRVDVGRFLPEPPPGVDTKAVIAFRERYDDERRRLIRAVENLIKQAAISHGHHVLADIDREVHEELDHALSDVKRAGRAVFGGWFRRTAWFTIATTAGAAIAGPAGAAAGSVAANWASNATPKGVKASDYAYLYRVWNALTDFGSETSP